MLTSALLGIIEDAGRGVLILTESVGDAQLLSLRLTRDETRRRLLMIADSVASLPPDARRQLSTIDWDGWTLLARALRGTDAGAMREALSFGVRTMVPATLLGLQLYRKSHPDLFVFRP